MESSAHEWFDSDESEFQMRTALRNSTALSPRGRLVLETLMVLMSLAAVTGNILVIVIVAATKTFHTVTSVLIINLAVSDFLVGIGVMPFVAVSILNNGWVNYNGLCLYVGYTSSVYCTASVLTLAAIALDRYFSIVDCLRYDSRCTIWRTCSVVLWIWLQAMLTSCPPLLGWSNISFVAPMYSCAVNWANSPSYTVIMASLSFLLPAIVILFCYVEIVRVARYHARRIHSLEEHLQRSRTTSVLNLQHSFMDTYTPSRLIYYVSGRFVTELDVPDEVAPDAPSEMSSNPTGGRLHSFMAQIHRSSPQHPSHHQHHGVLRLFLVIGAFLLCWTPYISVALVQATETALSRPRSLVPPSAVTFSYWLVLFNSDINPLLYALLSKRFQGAFQSLRRKIQARLGSVVARVGAQRSTGGVGGESDPTNRSTHSSTAHSRKDREPTYSSVFTLSSQFPNSLKEQLNNVLPMATSRPVCRECGGRSSRTVDLLQVPSKQCKRNRLPYSAATKKKQATFFYGQITVRVEHIC